MTGRGGRSGRIGRRYEPTLAAAAAGIGLLVDRWLGEPPMRLHAVVWFGRAMTALEQRLYADRRRHGVVYTAAGVTLGFVTGHLLQRVLGRRVAVVAATALAVGGRMLDDEASGIATRLEQGDLAGARLALGSLVGRRTDHLSEQEVVRAVIESVAENTVDAVTAALCFAVVGGAPAVAAYRAINTMDAMVGHRDARYQRFGWASARLDDAANLIPARLTAALVVAPLLLGRSESRNAGPHPEPHRTPEDAAPWSRSGRVAQIHAEAARHPSPNGGLVEAAFAHRLSIVLGGVNRYGDSTEDRGRLGHGRAPTRADIHRAVALRRQVSTITAVLLTLLTVLAELIARKPARRTRRTRWTRPFCVIRPWSAHRTPTGSGR